jgi:hypothetical protein
MNEVDAIRIEAFRQLKKNPGGSRVSVFHYDLS